MKKKLNKSKLFFSIFVPIASVVGLAAIVVPMACLINKNSYLIRTSEDRRHFVKLNEVNDIKFTYTFTQPNCSIENLKCDSWNYTISSLRNCKIVPHNFEKVDKNTFIFHLSLESVDNNNLDWGNSISFDLHFVYKNGNDVVWKQDMLNNYIKISGEDND